MITAKFPSREFLSVQFLQLRRIQDNMNLIDSFNFLGPYIYADTDNK